MKLFTSIDLLLKTLFLSGSLFILWADTDLDAQYSQVEFDMTRVSIRELSDLGIALDHAPAHQTILKIPVSAYDIQNLNSSNTPYRMVVKDFPKYIRERNAKLNAQSLNNPKEKRPSRAPENFKLGSMGGMLTFEEIIDDLDEMRRLFPTIVSEKFEIGRTGQDRPIYAIKISNRPDTDEERPRAHLNGLIHAREPMSMMNLMYFAWHLLEGYESNAEIKEVVDNLETYIIPCVNPDGYEFNLSTDPNGGGFWRKNRVQNADGSRGVDLNRNFDNDWGNPAGGSGDPGSDAYFGTDPFSELESQALRDLHVQRPFHIMMTWHSYGNVLIHPYGNGTDPDNLGEYVEISERLVFSNGWEYGAVPDVIGYVALGVETDWAHDELGEFAFGGELGSDLDGFWPRENRIASLAEEALDLNFELVRTALSEVVGVNHPQVNIADNFTLDVKSVGDQLIFKYDISDREKSWVLKIHSIEGKLLSQFNLSPMGQGSVSLLQDEAPSSLFILEVESCGRQACQTVYSQKMTKLSFK